LLLPLILAAFLLGAFVTPAAAQVEPLPGKTWLVPADGAGHPASSWPDATAVEMFEFSIYADDYDEQPASFDVEVAASPALDPDGTLADANRLDAYVATASAAFPETFSARTNVASRWLSIVGTYYWQAHYEEEDGELYGTDVRRLAITPRAAPDPPAAMAPPSPFIAPKPATIVPAPLSASTVRIIVRRAIVDGTHRSPTGLVYRCAGATTCRPSWRDARYAYRGTLQISSGLAGLHASFIGTRTTRSCARRCTRTVHWSTSL
jgi:hypothetical protein